MTKLKLIEVYGYTANSAFKLISSDEDDITFFELKHFFEKNRSTISMTDFKLLCAMHAKTSKEFLSKSEFLNLFTPFDRNVYYNIGDRSYHLLSLESNKKAFQSYIANTFLYKPKPETAIVAEDPRLREVAR